MRVSFAKRVVRLKVEARFEWVLNVDAGAVVVIHIRTVIDT